MVLRRRFKPALVLEDIRKAQGDIHGRCTMLSRGSSTSWKTEPTRPMLKIYSYPDRNWVPAGHPRAGDLGGHLQHVRLDEVAFIAVQDHSFNPNTVGPVVKGVTV